MLSKCVPSCRFIVPECSWCKLHCFPAETSCKSCPRASSRHFWWYLLPTDEARFFLSLHWWPCTTHSVPGRGSSQHVKRVTLSGQPWDKPLWTNSFLWVNQFEQYMILIDTIWYYAFHTSIIQHSIMDYYSYRLLTKNTASYSEQMYEKTTTNDSNVQRNCALQGSPRRALWASSHWSVWKALDCHSSSLSLDLLTPGKNKPNHPFKHL